MDVLKIDGGCYIWYAAGVYPYVIDTQQANPIATRDPNFPVNFYEHMLKYGIAETIRWENVPEVVKNCIISAQEVLIEEGTKRPTQRNKK